MHCKDRSISSRRKEHQEGAGLVQKVLTGKKKEIYPSQHIRLRSADVPRNAAITGVSCPPHAASVAAVGAPRKSVFNVNQDLQARRLIVATLVIHRRQGGAGWAWPRVACRVWITNRPSRQTTRRVPGRVWATAAVGPLRLDPVRSERSLSTAAVSRFSVTIKCRASSALL